MNYTSHFGFMRYIMVDLMYEVSKIAQGMIFGKLHGFTRKKFYDENRKKE